MAYKQNGINILGTGLGGKETDTNRGKGLGGDEIQRTFGETIEVPTKVPKVQRVRQNNQTSIDGIADFKNSMDAMPVRGIPGKTANTSKTDGFEKARNRGNNLPAGNSFTDLGIATAKNILSGAKEGINRYKEKRAAIKGVKNQFKTEKNKKSSVNGRSIMTDAVKTSAKNIKDQQAPTRFTKAQTVKPKASTAASTSIKTKGMAIKPNNIVKRPDPKPVSRYEGKMEAYDTKQKVAQQKRREDGFNKPGQQPVHPNMQHHPGRFDPKPTAADLRAKSYEGKQEKYEAKQSADKKSKAYQDKVKSNNFNMSKYF